MGRSIRIVELPIEMHWCIIARLDSSFCDEYNMRERGRSSLPIARTKLCFQLHFNVQEVLKPKSF